MDPTRRFSKSMFKKKSPMFEYPDSSHDDEVKEKLDDITVKLQKSREKHTLHLEKIKEANK